MRWRRCSRTTGPATSASYATSSSAPARWPTRPTSSAPSCSSTATRNGSGKDTPTAHGATDISSPDVSRPLQVEGPPTIDDHIGQVIADRYQLHSVLGRGGMGTVYLAEHLQLKKKVAVKLLADEL